MKHSILPAVIGAALSAALLLGFQAAQRPALADEKTAHYDLDVVEMDRTTTTLTDRINALNLALKQVAKKVTAANLDDPDKNFEKQLQAEFEKVVTPLLEDATLLLVQTFLLALDNAADTGGAAIEAAILGEMTKRTGIPAADLKARTEKERLGIGGVVLGYAIAKAAKVSPDEIFANKADSKSWPEVMRARQITFAQLQAVLDEKPE